MGGGAGGIEGRLDHFRHDFLWFMPPHLLAGRHGMTDPRWAGRLRSIARHVDIVHLHSPAVAAVARPVAGEIDPATRADLLPHITLEELP